MRPAIVCPFCGGAFEEGFAELFSTWVESLFWGASPSTLVFIGGSTAEIEVLVPAQRRRAGECRVCKALLVTGELWTS